MKILAINGSHRKGNTDFLLSNLLEDTDIIRLREKKITFCGGGDDCCPKTGTCYIKDDMPEIEKKLVEADLVILASPCYFFNVTAMMKNFMDRCNPFFFNLKLKGKKFFLIPLGGHPNSLPDALVCMKNFVKGIHGEAVGEYSAVANRRGDMSKNEKVIKELEDLKSRIKNL
ncbi:MAG TPA: flavodoxin family protein [Candidatus Nanoarchaeia archaeon]|nr:flavodoxin family protein [Candidatus Nanoarchaeia archaeon]